MDTTTRRNRRAALAALLSGVLAATAAGLACAATPPAAPPGQPVIVVLGDSLSAEYGLPRDTGWVALLRQRLATERIDYSVANASVSGDTTSGGRARLP
ncbi:SGNH/GDSL hydrolase family protein, partial [Burkholderia ubonensis]